MDTFKPRVDQNSPDVRKELSEEERKLSLQQKLNYPEMPGRHSKESPVVGSRLEEWNITRELVDRLPEVVEFERAIYKKENVYIIPEQEGHDADELAKKFFLEYISKYSDSGINTDNIVSWVQDSLPGAGSNKTWIYDVENEWNTWNLHAAIEDSNTTFEGKCLPKHIAAYHEVMHMEETPKGAPESLQGSPGREIMSTIKTIILLDQIYKSLKGLRIEESVDYNREITWGKNSIKLGELANIYRSLEQKYGSICEAIISPESIQLVTKGALL